MVDEHLGYPVTLGLFIIQIPDAILVKPDYISIRNGQEDGGVSDDDILGSFSRHLGDSGEKRQLPLGGQGGFWFVHDENTGLCKGLDEVQKTLTV